MDIYTATEEAYKKGYKDGERTVWSNDAFVPSPGEYYVIRTVIGHDSDGSPLISEPMVYRYGMSVSRVWSWMPIPMVD